MPGLTPVQPAPPACRLCLRPAVGQCAVCHGWLCADCAELTPGLSRRLAVCPSCVSKRPQAGVALLMWLVIPALVLGGLVALVLMLLR